MLCRLKTPLLCCARKVAIKIAVRLSIRSTLKWISEIRKDVCYCKQESCPLWIMYYQLSLSYSWSSTHTSHLMCLDSRLLFGFSTYKCLLGWVIFVCYVSSQVFLNWQNQSSLCLSSCVLSFISVIPIFPHAFGISYLSFRCFASQPQPDLFPSSHSWCNPLRFLCIRQNPSVSSCIRHNTSSSSRILPFLAHLVRYISFSAPSKRLLLFYFLGTTFSLIPCSESTICLVQCAHFTIACS